MSRMKFGVHLPLEEMATALLRDSMKDVKSHSAKRDILTPWKEQDRRRREVYPSSGVADASLRRGVYGRAINKSKPYLNARDIPGGRVSVGRGSSRSLGIDSLRSFYEEFSDGA